jgi:hypothetical protein
MHCFSDDKNNCIVTLCYCWWCTMQMHSLNCMNYDAITSTIYFTLFEFHSYDRERGVCGISIVLYLWL